MGDKIRLIYPLALADGGMGDKTRVDIPVGFRGRGYGRQNQVDYTRWFSRTRVWETKPGLIYPLAFADKGMEGKIRLIIPADLRGQGYGR